MIRKFLKKLKKKSNQNQQGSVLVVALIVMVVLTASVTAITNLTIDQEYATQIKSETVFEETTGKSLIQLSISEFEAYIRLTEDFAAYDLVEIPLVETKYGVFVTDVSGTPGFEEFTVTTEGESKAYRFAYPISNGNTLVMYSYVSTTGSSVESFDPFDFSLGTNGDLILSGGYYGQANLFGENIYFGIRSQYIREKANGNLIIRATGKNISTYPDFYTDGSSSFVQANIDYQYCNGNCWDFNGVNNPYTIEKSEYLDIAGSSLEQGVVNPATTITDFFGDFDYDQTVLDFVTDIGPTNSRTISDAITIDTIRDVVYANSGDATVWSPGNGNGGGGGGGNGGGGGWFSWVFPSDEDYTRITDLATFTPLTDEESLNFGAFYDGDLTIGEGLHMVDRDDEALIIAGDLIVDNDDYITMDGKFVILGDLIFQGATVDMDGAFYVLGETHFDFDDGEGLQERGNTSEYGMTLMAKNSVFFDSMWRSESSPDLPDYSLEVFIYTEESIYVEAVNSRVYVRGVFFSAGKDVSTLGVDKTDFPVLDEAGDPINGIVINSYRGYTNNNGALVQSNDVDNNGFYFLRITEDQLRDAYTEIPVFESLVVTEGVYSFETSEFYYE